MRLFSKSNVATIAIVTGIVVASGTGGAVAGAMITGKQIKDGTVTTADIKNGSLKRTDIAPSSRGVRGLKLMDTQQQVAAPETAANLSQDCPAGRRLVSATAYWTESSRAVQVAFGENNAAAFSSGSDVANDIIRLQLICAAPN